MIDYTWGLYSKSLRDLADVIDGGDEVSKVKGQLRKLRKQVEILSTQVCELRRECKKLRKEVKKQ